MSEVIEITLPESDQEGTEVRISRWMKKVGDPVRIHEPLLEVSTDKVEIEVPSPADGFLSHILKKENDEVEAGESLGRIQVSAAKPAEAEGAPAKAAPSPEIQSLPSSLRLSPSVRRLIKEHGLDPERIAGSGRGGRITLSDAHSYLKAQGGDRESAAPLPRPSRERSAGSRRIPHTPMRLGIARHMVKSQLRTAPHVTAVFEADLSAVTRHRRERKAEFASRGANLTLTAYFVAAGVRALQSVPEINSRWHDDALELIDDCNIGIATALDEGLIVPVVRAAQELDLFSIAQRLQDLTDRARSGRLAPGDVQGGTFTITNHGVSGSLIATPIINQPQSAILGVGKLEKRVVVREVDGADTLQIRPMIYITLTIDHRGLDGYQANRFLAELVAVLEDWP